VSLTRTRLSIVVCLLLVAGACSRSDSTETGGDTTTTTAAEGPAGSLDNGDFGDLTGVCKDGDAAGATATGVTDTEIHVGSVTDKGFAAAAGLNKEMYDAAVAFAAWCNEHGGILGRKIVVEVENSRFRAGSGTPAEQAGVRDSFAYSTLWMGDIAAETPDGRLLVDVASFLTRDEMGIAQALKDGGGGEFRLASELSVADPASVRVFPQNIEMEGRLTFTSAAQTAEVGNIAPATGNLSFVVRHSLIRLPEPGYQPRRFDPRAGTFGSQVVDFAQPLGRPIVYELANRFRLEKVDPGAARSRVRRPIVFHIDRAAPVDIPVGGLRGERIVGPALRWSRHDIQVGEQQERVTAGPVPA